MIERSPHFCAVFINVQSDCSRQFTCFLFHCKEGGVSINDCETMSRTMDPLLDEADPIEESYLLEVSSPGIERELKTPEHIDACEGWDVEVKLYAPRNGSKVFRGVLCGYNDDNDIVIGEGDEKIVFKPEEIAKISTYFDFSNS